MRIWDVSPKILCRKHLLGEHRELHALWTILTTGKKGYLNHPETKRWVGKLAALYNRHDEEVFEMERRGYQHHSPLDKKLATGSAVQEKFVNTVEEQEVLLKNKNCDCRC
ncbi:MAG TPA: pyrimidine dimer DNA glycosylase/endonuclease V [Patescibacteria group bacterium]|nr:pyrimidine dimer DNA glycosylase/endonuclease V [Patescibacteria group bacterium]